MKRFLQIARGSASELEYHLLLAQRSCSFWQPRNSPIWKRKLIEIQRMLASLSQRLQRPILARS